MSNFVTDSFTDTNGVLLTAHTPEVGGPITSKTGTSGKIQSNELVSDGSTLSSYYYAATPPSPDYNLSFTMDIKSIVSLDTVALLARLDTAGNNWYQLEWGQNLGAYRIIKEVNGVGTVLGTWTNTPSVARHTLKFTVSGSNPVRLVATVDGVDRITVSDSSSPLTSAGKVGLTVRKSSSAGTGIWLDDFSAAANGPLNTVAPGISGTVRIGQSLTTDGGTWQDDGNGSLSYQWQRSQDGTLWENIAGATTTSYTLSGSDDGEKVQVLVTDTDSNGSDQAASSPVGPVIITPTAGQRSWPVPPADLTTIHFIGDMHHGSTAQSRLNKALADFSHPLAPTPVAHIQVGDQVNDGLSSQDTLALAWLAKITDAPVYVGCGNHDIHQNTRPIATWIAAYSAYLNGSNSQNYVIDFSDLRVIVIGPDALTSTTFWIYLTQNTLDWLDARLAETAKDCWIVCHNTLASTILASDQTNYWSSDISGIAIFGPNLTDDSEIRTILANRSNAKAWIHGHDHAPVWATGLASLTRCGSRDVAVIDTCSLNWEGQVLGAFEPFHSAYVTRLSSGAIEVRYRDNGAGVWAAPMSERVTTLIPS